MTTQIKDNSSQCLKAKHKTSGDHLGYIHYSSEYLYTKM